MSKLIRRRLNGATMALPTFVAESLERRMLLSGSLLVVPSASVAVSGFSLSSPIPDGSAGTAYATVSQAANGTAGNNLQITGDVILEWYGGGQLADLPLTQQTGGITSTAFSDQIPCTLNESSAGPAIPSGPLKGYHILEYYYAGDGNFAPTAQFTDADFQNAAAGNGAAGNVLLVKFSSTQSKLAFIQNPSNAAANDTIKPPVTVAVEDSSGNILTTASDTVTLAIASGSGTLSGTLSEPAVNGIATFTNLSIDQMGNYTLRATDATTSSIAAATSSLFGITGGKLVFRLPTPAVGTAGDPLQPDIQVALEDGHGTVDTSNSTTVVTLLPIGATSANPITGNTATLANGVATFSNVVLAKPGFYQLQATDGGDATDVTRKIKVTGDHLSFARQPASADAGVPIPLTVKLLNSKGQLDTSATTVVQLSLNTVGVGTGAQLTGTRALQFIAGVATFTPTDGPIINTGGVYSLTATEEDTSSGTLAPTNTTKPITTRPFRVGSLALVVDQQPADGDVNAPIALSVRVEDQQHNVVAENLAIAQLSLTVVSHGTGAVLAGTTSALFANGVATFTPADGLMINVPGTYELSISETGPSSFSTATSDTTPVVTHRFDINGDHLVFLKQPTDADEYVTHFVEFPDQQTSLKVAIEDSKHHIITSNNSSSVRLTVPGAASGTQPVVPFQNGIATLPPGLAGQGLVVTSPGLGTFRVLATDVDAAGTPILTTTTALSAPFHIGPYHLVIAEPSNTPANQGINFSVGMVNDKGTALMSPQGNTFAAMAITLIKVHAPLQAALTVVQVGFAGGVLKFSTPEAINLAGTYRLMFTASISSGPQGSGALTPVADIRPVISRPFKIT